MSVDNFNWFLHVMFFLHTEKVIQRQKKKREIWAENDNDEEENSDLGE
jgi:hypothetical protein